MNAQILTHPSRYRERIQDAQDYADALEYDLARLRETDGDGVPSLSWCEFYAGAVSRSGTEREKQDRAVADCTAALEQAERDLEALRAQETAAMERRGGNTR